MLFPFVVFQLDTKINISMNWGAEPSLSQHSLWREVGGGGYEVGGLEKHYFLAFVHKLSDDRACWVT